MLFLPFLGILIASNPRLTYKPTEVSNSRPINRKNGRIKHFDKCYTVSSTFIDSVPIETTINPCFTLMSLCQTIDNPILLKEASTKKYSDHFVYSYSKIKKNRISNRLTIYELDSKTGIYYIHLIVIWKKIKKIKVGEIIRGLIPVNYFVYHPINSDDHIKSISDIDNYLSSDPVFIKLFNHFFRV
jgi:hypothetical protein